MQKPCRLEINNRGSWKLLGTFDASVADAADAIMEAAAALAAALNDPACKRPGPCSLRVSTDPDAMVLMRWTSAELGWRDAATGEPA